MNEQYKIKEYEHWDVYLHDNQKYIGRVVIWARREDAVSFRVITDEEAIELKSIVGKVEDALAELFRPDGYDYAVLSNEARHLHLQVVPRYETEREFGGIIFEDRKWGRIFEPYETFQTPERTLMEMKESIEEKLKAF